LKVDSDKVVFRQRNSHVSQERPLETIRRQTGGNAWGTLKVRSGKCLTDELVVSQFFEGATKKIAQVHDEAGNEKHHRNLKEIQRPADNRTILDLYSAMSLGKMTGQSKTKQEDDPKHRQKH